MRGEPTNIAMIIINSLVILQIWERRKKGRDGIGEGTRNKDKEEGREAGRGWPKGIDDCRK